MRNLPNVRDESAYLELRGVKIDENVKLERTGVELERKIGTMLEYEQTLVKVLLYTNLLGFKCKRKKRERQSPIT